MESTPPEEDRERIGPPEAQVGATAPDFDEPHEEADRAASRRRALLATAVTCAVLSTLSLLWIGGELHYRNCLDSAELRTLGKDDELSNLARTQAADTCSRSPF